MKKETKTVNNKKIVAYMRIWMGWYYGETKLQTLQTFIQDNPFTFEERIQINKMENKIKAIIDIA